MVFKGYLFILSCLALLESQAQTINADFTVPAQICTGKTFTIANNTTGGSTYNWNFCASNPNQAPTGDNFGSFGGLLDEPAFMDIVFTGNNYYGFVTNYRSGDLIRLDFGSSLLNTPVAVNLGNFDGAIPPDGAGGIQVVQNNGRWYAIIVAGFPPSGKDPSIIIINFGGTITNVNATAKNWGNVGDMYQPNELVLLQEGNRWIGFTVNGGQNNITRFDFSTSFDDQPTGTNLGNVGNLSEPSGIYFTKNGNEWIALITNAGDNTRTGGYFTITKLNFGTSLLNIPDGQNMGNVGNTLEHPRDIALVSHCDQLFGFVLNGHPLYNTLIRLNYNNDITSYPSSLSFGNIANMDYPYSITDFFRIGDELVAMVVNKGNNTITRVVFTDCNNSSVASSTDQNPPAISYNQPGIYNIRLTVNQGQADETSLCKEVIVSSCTDTLILTNDTTICAGGPMQIRTRPAFLHQWTPATFLDNPNAASPVTTTPQKIKYYVDALVMGPSAVVNGDFSAGNADFNSGYTYSPTNVVEGEYFVGKDPKTWNIALDYCNDHTSGSGQMLFVNGSPSAKVVWSQTVTVKPNTDYLFATWVQALWSVNPATLQFFINGTPTGNPFTATVPACNWSQNYTIWNSGSNTTVTISIVDINTVAVGNDFAIDDIAFVELIPVRDSITIDVRQPYIKANEDTTICSGGSVQLYVDQGAFFTWSPSTGLSNSGIPNPVASPTTTTEYIVVGIDPGGCLAKDTVIINVKPSPVVNLIADTLICKGTQVQLSATGGGTYEWTPSEGLSGTAIPNPVVSTLTPRQYIVKVTAANGCITRDSVNISIQEYPQFAASGAQDVCVGNPVTITASGGDIYQWSPAASFSDPSLPTHTFVPDASAVYSVNIRESACNNDTTISIAVGVNPLPVISVKKSNDINCNVPTAVLEATGAEKYSWTPLDGLSDSVGFKTTVSTDITTTYTVTGTNEYGCSSSESITVNVDKSGVPRFVVPNAFTPNNDGKNDCFGIQHWGNADIRQFSIYNRWGTIVFQTSDPSQCWDGKWKGQAQDGGGYIYIIKANTLCGEVTRKGMLLLIR